jgi:hypothetical protein
MIVVPSAMSQWLNVSLSIHIQQIAGKIFNPKSFFGHFSCQPVYRQVLMLLYYQEAFPFYDDVTRKRTSFSF